MNDRQRTGQISVSVKEDGLPGASLQTAGARVDVLDRRLRLLKRTHSRDAISVAPGRYVVAVTFPDGSRRTQQVEARAGETTRVDLTWTAPRGEIVRARATSKAVPGPAPDQFYMRFVEFSGGLGIKAVVDPPSKEVEDHESKGGVLDATIVVQAQPNSRSVRFAEVATRSGRRATVGLPIADVGQARSARMTVALSGDGLDVDVQILGSPEAVTVSQFMASGHVADAAVPAAAEEMLRGKQSHPFGAALGGYALLRLKNLERLHNWPQNLAAWFAWLPDAHVILGEQQLREGDVEEAFTHFRRALDTGLPVFTDGFSILSARLRALAKRETRAGVSGRLRAEAEGALEALSGWTPWVQFDAVHTTLERADDSPITPVEGWQRFRPPFGLALDPSFFWSNPRE